MKKKSNVIIVPTRETIEFVPVDTIIRCEAKQNKTLLVLTDGKSILSFRGIGVYEDHLISYGFASCHKSFIVNLRYVVRYHKDGHVEQIDGSLVPVSRRKKSTFFSGIENVEEITSL